MPAGQQQPPPAQPAAPGKAPKTAPAAAPLPPPAPPEPQLSPAEASGLLLGGIPISAEGARWTDLAQEELQQHHFHEATAAFSEATVTDKGNPIVWSNLGTAWLSSGRPDKALSAFKHALRLEPNYALAHYNLGASYDQIHDYENAVTSYARALELDPTLADPAVNPSIVNNRHMAAVHTILYQKQIGALGAAMPSVTKADDEESGGGSD
jgi:Tfp pilus assembly protein PilF